MLPAGRESTTTRFRQRLEDTVIRRLIVPCLLILGFGTALADNAPSWLRYPAISPDGQTIVFGYKGDLYRVPASGGTAFPLTSYAGHDHRPVWSRDGSRLAFASDRYGNFDVYVMPAEGGPSRRITFHSADDFPSDFTPDGDAVIFSSARVDAASNAQFPSSVLSELYQIALDGGRARRLLTTPAEEARFDRSGTTIIFQDRKGYEDPLRKHHTSSVTRDVWTYDLKQQRYARLTPNIGEDRNPVFAPDGKSYYYLSEPPGGTFNVYRASIGGGTPTALTRFEHHPVRFLSASDDGTLCFTYHGEIYRLRGAGAPEKVEIRILGDDGGRDITTESIGGGATEMAVSPSGKEVAFVARGEIFVTSVESKITRRVTSTPQQERSIDFSPDGRSIVFAAERGSGWNLYRVDLAREDEDYFFNSTILEEKPVLVSDADTFQPQFSPTGKEIAYLENRTTVKVLDLDSGESRTILDGSRNFSYADGDQYFDWSPDGKWLLVEFLQPSYWISEAGLVSADGTQEVINLTRSGYYDSAPKWMMAGKMMIWFSNRDGLQGHAKTGPSEGDVYGAWFTQEGYDRALLTKEELDLLKEREKKDKEKKEKETEGEKDEDGDGKGKKKKKGDEDKDDAKDEDEDDELPEVEIELDNIEDRRRRLTIHSSRLADAVVSSDGEKLIYLAQFEKGYDLWVTELRTRETKILAKLGSSGGSLSLDKEGEHVFLLSGGSLSRFEIESGKQKSIAIDGEMSLDRRAEREYLFEHAWRQVREKFYDPSLHGLDWDFLHDQYVGFLPHIDNNYDFAEMLGELLGELNASHTGARYRHSSENGDSTASLGLLYDESHAGPGLLIAEVLPKNPILHKGSRIAAGVTVVSIDGQEIGVDTNPHRLLNRKADSYTRLGLRDAKGETWEETVKPISGGRESSLLYERWVRNRRARADELSGGRIGYVHVRGMNDSSFRVVQEEVLGRHANQEALVIDTRFNGGGDLVDDLSIFLSGEKYMDFVPPDGRSIGMEPSRRWTKPSIVLMSEGNYSDAHCFPWAYWKQGIGKTVGAPVPGTCTFVWWERLQDRSLVFGIPNMGIHDSEGRYLENLQLEPDILVESDPARFSVGDDPQLDRAIEELLRQLDSDSR